MIECCGMVPLHHGHIAVIVSLGESICMPLIFTSFERQVAHVRLSSELQLEHKEYRFFLVNLLQQIAHSNLTMIICSYSV